MGKLTLNRAKGRRTLHQGTFKPKHPEKYVGDASNIVFRSGWERRMMKFFDEQVNVLKWSSEELIIPYYDPVTGRDRRYFPDFLAEFQDTTGNIITMVIEVKPLKETMPPKKGKGKRVLAEAATYATNSSKFKAAEQFCAKKGWHFKIITEKELLGK